MIDFLAVFLNSWTCFRSSPNSNVLGLYFRFLFTSLKFLSYAQFFSEEIRIQTFAISLEFNSVKCLVRGIWLRCLLVTPRFYLGTSNWEDAPGRPSTRWRDYISHLAWERLRIPQKELERVTGERGKPRHPLSWTLDRWTPLHLQTYNWMRTKTVIHATRIYMQHICLRKSPGALTMWAVILISRINCAFTQGLCIFNSIQFSLFI